jgi:hypothetical protein
MNCSSFFLPIEYDAAKKRIPERILEAVDEYLYLGGSSRILISKRDNTLSPQFTKTISNLNRQRSRTNLALKAVSYCTVALPIAALLSKVALRCFLKISSIKTVVSYNSHLDVGLAHSGPIINSFLTHAEQSSLARTALFARDSNRDYDAFIQDQISALKIKIDRLPPLPLSAEEFQPLLIETISSPISGHPKHWIPVLESLMSRYAFSDDLIQGHNDIATMLRSSLEFIDSKMMYNFCDYLVKKYLFDEKPWMIYRALEQYMPINQAGVVKVILKHLMEKARSLVDSTTAGFKIGDGRILNFEIAEISTNEWFGEAESNYSLWRNNDLNDNSAPLPPLVEEVLVKWVQALAKWCKRRSLPFALRMDKNGPAEGFVRQLAPMLSQENAEIVYCNGSLGAILFGFGHRDAFELRRMVALADKFPKAVERDHRYEADRY